MTCIFRDNDLVYADLAPEEGVLLHLQTKHYFRLNETSQIIFKHLRKGDSLEAAANALCDEFEISPEQALNDVKAFVGLLSQEGFLETNRDSLAYSLAQAKEDKARSTKGA